MANFLKSLFVKGVEIDTASATTGKVLTYDGTKFAPATPGSGSLALDDLSDVVITSPATTQFVRYNGTNFVNATISAGDVPTLNQNTTGNAATVTTNANLTGDVTSSGNATAIASNVIVNDDINTAAAIALSKLASGTSAQVVIANGSGVPTYNTLTGDVTVTNTGVTAIGATKVTRSMLAATEQMPVPVSSEITPASWEDVVAANCAKVLVVRATLEIAPLEPLTVVTPVLEVRYVAVSIVQVPEPLLLRKPSVPVRAAIAVRSASRG